MRGGSNAARAFLHAGRLGFYRLVTDGTGSIKDEITYLAFGKVASETDSSWGGYFKFTGMRSVPGLGMQRHTTGRWFDFLVGVWTTPDPIGFQGKDYNLSRYVGNNPVSFTDPSAGWT